MLAILSAHCSQLGLKRVLISIGQSQMSGICFMCRTQNAELHDSVLDSVENCSSIGYLTFPEEVRAYLFWLSLLSYYQFFV